MWLLVAFLAVPLIEIALFVQVGGLIGLWPTLAIVILTALAGTALMRREGAKALDDLRRSFNDLSDPSEPLAHGALILLAGALLLTPGFFTDACGLLLLIAPVRRQVFVWARSRVNIKGFAAGPGTARRPGRDNVIDGEFEEVPPPKHPTHGPSGWTRH